MTFCFGMFSIDWLGYCTVDKKNHFIAIVMISMMMSFERLSVALIVYTNLRRQGKRIEQNTSSLFHAVYISDPLPLVSNHRYRGFGIND